LTQKYRVTIIPLMDSNRLKRLKYYFRFLTSQEKYLNTLNGGNKILVRSVAPIFTELNNLHKEFPDVETNSFEISDDELAKYVDYLAFRSFISRAVAKLDVEINQQDDAPNIQKREFPFIKNTDLKKIVERDYQEIQRAYISNCWKSVIILSGGIIEAILTDLLVNNIVKTLAAKSAPKEKDVNKWEFSKLIDVSVELKYVSDGMQKLSHPIREYRNLVHPSNEIRNKLIFSAEEAKIAVEILHILHRDLSH
jgi:hypothetical protein